MNSDLQIVSSTNDSGTGTLRAALSSAASAYATYEAIAHGIRARALLRRDSAAASAGAKAALANAAALVERIGATTLCPALREWRAELASTLGDAPARERLLHEAQAGYLEIGAPLRAERIARSVAD